MFNFMSASFRQLGGTSSGQNPNEIRSEEHTSELQSRQYSHFFLHYALSISNHVQCEILFGFSPLDIPPNSLNNPPLHDQNHPSPIPAFIFFFLMIRRPPRSTLFPTRRSSDLKSR